MKAKSEIGKATYFGRDPRADGPLLSRSPSGQRVCRGYGGSDSQVVSRKSRLARTRLAMALKFLKPCLYQARGYLNGLESF